MAAGHATTTDQSMRDKGWLLVAEAARKIGVTPQTIYRWIEDKKVTGLRDGYRRYVSWASVMKHLGPHACAVRGLLESDVNKETKT